MTEMPFSAISGNASPTSPSLHPFKTADRVDDLTE
jgi:hypothetical protein